MIKVKRFYYHSSDFHAVGIYKEYMNISVFNKAKISYYELL
jgi:hypothetical protein